MCARVCVHACVRACVCVSVCVQGNIKFMNILYTDMHSSGDKTVMPRDTHNRAVAALDLASQTEYQTALSC